jgi:pimeloyl-ACP methyl ester carboxylesterase
MSELRIVKGYVDGLWGQVHYRRAGNGPALVLLHQTSVSGRMFEAGMSALARRGFLVFALDTPGYGQSDPPPAPPSMPDYAENLRQVLDALDLRRPHFLGHHTGAGIAAIHAARCPERLDKLIMQGVPWFDPDTLEYFRRVGFRPFLPRPDGGHLIDAWNQRLAVSPGWTDIDAMHRYTVDMLMVNRSYYWGFEAALAHDLQPDLEAIQTPTLLLINSGDSAFALTLRTAELRPDFAYVEHPGGTNDYIDEQPELWADSVAKFLSDPSATYRTT